MKQEKGITITSLAVYVVAMVVVIGIISTISTYFYNNMEELNTDKHSIETYTKFNMYFTEEINIKQNYAIYSNIEDLSLDYNYIIFSKTGNQYTFENNSIYKNQIKICDNIADCSFNWNETDKLVTVKIQTTDNIEYLNTYKIQEF